MAVTGAMLRASALLSSWSLSSGELTRKRAAKTSGAGASTVRKVRMPLRVAYAAARATPGGSGEREREPRGRVAGPDHDLERDERRQPGDEHQVKRLLRARVDEPGDDLGEDQEERRPEQEPQRQHNQVERGRPAHDEELRRVTQQVVERLGDGEGREDEQVDAAGRVAAEVLEPRAHVDGKVVSARREPRRGRRA